MANANSKAESKSAEKEQKNDIPRIDVRINALRNDDTHIKGYASANIGGAFAIHGISIIEGKNGLFMSMPQRSFTDESGEKKYSDIFHAVTKEAYDELNGKVISAYKEAYAESQNAAEESDFEEIPDEDEGLEPSM
jgi:stage V sporulation protein G